MKQFINNLIVKRNSNSYIKFLKRKGIQIGAGCIFLYRRSIEIDYSRASLVEIGDNVFFNYGFTLMCHDFASWTFLHHYNDFIPSYGPIVIGNNVTFTRNCTVLKGARIGDNCIIGYGSVVMSEIPSNSVAVGCPARVISTLEDYYNKRLEEYKGEVLVYVKSFFNRFGKLPSPEDLYDDFPAFVNKYNYHDYNLPYNRVFLGDKFNFWLEKHQSQYNNFQSLLNDALNGKI